MNPTLAAQASQSAQQGQQLISQDQATAANSKNDYTNFNTQATQANQDLQKQTQYMQGAGSGENVYNRELTTQENNAGFNPQQLSDANASLFGLTGTLNSTNRQFSTAGGVGAYGMSAPALASYEGSILNPLQTGVANANTEVGALNSELGTLETGAGQATNAQVTTEQNTVDALNKAVVNYQTQASAALQNMQFYSNLASTQGSLNAQEQANFAAAQQSYAAAQQAIAQSKLILAQTTGQNYTNEAAYNQLHPTTPGTPTGSVPGIAIQGGNPTAIPLQATGGAAAPRVQGSAIPLQAGGGNVQGGNVSLQ